jgi:hypothetical protein
MQATFLCVDSAYYMSCAGPIATGYTATLACPVGSIILGLPYVDYGTVPINTGCGTWEVGMGIPSTSEYFLPV